MNAKVLPLVFLLNAPKAIRERLIEEKRMFNLCGYDDTELVVVVPPNLNAYVVPR